MAADRSIPLPVLVVGAAAAFTVATVVSGAASAAALEGDHRPLVPQNLVLNPGFEDGRKHWTSWKYEQKLTTVEQAKFGKLAAQLRTTKRRSFVGLAQQHSDVKSPAAGTRYRMTAWVRSSQRGMAATLHVNENFERNTDTHRSTSALDGRRWTKISMGFRTLHQNSRLAVNLRANGLKKKHFVRVDRVRLVLRTPDNTP